jgi:hypothetical protein
LAAVERLAKQILPTSFTTEWTEIALQQKLAGNSAIYIFPLCILFVFLLLSAPYESWTLPLGDGASCQLVRNRRTLRQRNGYRRGGMFAESVTCFPFFLATG